jgi:hypothetical protein
MVTFWGKIVTQRNNLLLVSFVHFIQEDITITQMKICNPEVRNHEALKRDRWIIMKRLCNESL